MIWKFSFYSIAAALTSIFLIRVAFLMKEKKEHPAAGYGLWLIVFSFIWVTGSLFETAAATLQTKILIKQFEYIGIPMSAVFFLLFSIAYTSLLKKTLKAFSIILPLLSAGFLLLFWTNPLHNLFWTSFALTSDNGLNITYGPLFWVMAAFLYSFMGTGLILNLINAVITRGIYKKQAVIVFAAALVVISWNLVYVFKLIPLMGYDFTPLAFGIMVVLISYAVPKYEFLALLPIAGRRVMEAMHDSFLVIDLKGHLADFNPSAALRFNLSLKNMGQKAEDLFAKWPGLLENMFSDFENEEEWMYSLEPMMILSVRVTFIKDELHHIIGRLVTFHDNSLIRKTEMRLQECGEEFKALMENSRDALIFLNEMGFIDCNTEALKLFGFDNKNELTAADPAEVLGGDSPVVFKAKIKEAFDTGSCRLNGKFKRKNGEEFQADVLLSVFELKGEKVLLVSVRDMTGWKQPG